MQRDVGSDVGEAVSRDRGEGTEELIGGRGGVGRGGGNGRIRPSAIPSGSAPAEVRPRQSSQKNHVGLNVLN